MENVSDFDFYLRFSKPLILNLPQINDRALAAAWVKKLANDKDSDEKIKLDYLKLLLFVMQRKKLAPPFTKHPNALEALEPFPAEQTLVDVAKHIIEQENTERREKQRGDSGDYPPYISDFSADLLEYVAVQEIEDFGTHGYYAVSKEPVNIWYRVDKQLFPKAAKSMLDVSPTPAGLVEVQSTPEIGEKSPEKEKGEKEAPPPTPPQAPPREEEEPPIEEPPPEVEAPPPEPEQPEPPPREPTPSPKKKSPRKSSLGATPPSRPIGKVSPPAEDREPPTWGSNLLEAKFLEEDVGDVVQKAEGGEFVPGGSPDMELLWSSPPGASHRYSLDDEGIEFPDYMDLEASPEAEEEQVEEEGPMTPFFPAPMSPIAQQSYASPEPQEFYVSPVGRRVSPPRPKARPVRKPKKPPQVKMTRSAMLRQQKEEEKKKPPPPPPEKKPSKGRVAKKPSKPKVEAKPKEEAPPPKEEVKKVPSKKGVAKKPSKGKVKGKKPPEKEKAIAEPPFGSPGEPFHGFPMDEVESYVAEYSKLLQDLEGQYQEDMQRYRREHGGKKAVMPTVATKKPHKKQQLSKVAKMSRQAIPKAHDAPVELDKSIHLSPEAREILGGIIEGPSTSTGITHAPDTSLRHPEPKLGHIIEEEDEGGDEEWPTEADEEEEEGGEEGVEYATTEGRGKDPRIVDMYNSLADATLDMDNEDLDDFEALERQLEEEEAAKPKKPKDPEDEEFEEMERMIEEEMRMKGKDPHKRKKKMPRHDMKARQEYYALKERLEAEEDQLFREDSDLEEEEWTAGEGFFAPQDAAIRPKTPARKMILDEEEADLVTDDFLPESPKRRLQDLEGEMAKLQGDIPAFQGLPLTTPRHISSPIRITGEDGAVEFIPKKHEAGLWMLKKGMDDPEAVKAFYEKYKYKKPASPPHTEEEFLEIPKTPTKVLEKFPPEHFQYQYESPGIKYGERLPMVPPDVSAISPESKDWFVKLSMMHDTLYGPQTTPTMYDLPADELFDEEVEPQEYDYVESQDFMGELAGHVPTAERRPIQMPYKRMRTLPKATIQPELEVIPEMEFADEDADLSQLASGYGESVFDTTPPGFAQDSPPAPINIFSQFEEWDGALDETPPSFMEEDERDPETTRIYTNVAAATGMWPPKAFPRKKAPKLEAIGSSPVYYPPSPTAREQAPESPEGRQGPLRRTVRRKLKKKRLEFGEEPKTPDDETQVEVTEVETKIEDDAEMAERLKTPPRRTRKMASPERMWAEGKYYPGVTAPDGTPTGTPRTPQDVYLDSEDMPLVEDLPEFDPVSPLSEWGLLEGMYSDVKQHVIKRRPGGKGIFQKVKYKYPERVTKRPKVYRKKSSEFFRTHPWRKLEKVREIPFEEEIYKVREEAEDLAAQDLAAAAAEEAAKRTLLDEPVPDHLPSPIKGPVQVPFYSTPPHLARLKLLPWPKGFRSPKAFKEGPQAYITTEDEDLDEFERFERAIHRAEGEPVGIGLGPVKVLGAVGPHEVAEREYASLFTPPPPTPPTPRRRGPPKQQSMAEIMAEVQAMPPSPTYVRLKAEERQREIAEAQAKAEAERRAYEEEKAAAKAALEAKKAAAAAKKAEKFARLMKGTTTAKLRAQAAKAKAGKDAKVGETEFKLEQKTTHKPLKAKGRGPKPPPYRPPKKSEVKGKALAAASSGASVKSEQSVKSAKSDQSVKSAKSAKSAKSDTSIRRKKFKVASKIDTGRATAIKKKPKVEVEEQEEEAAPPMEVEYDMAAMHDLGVTAADLHQLNMADLDDAVLLEAQPFQFAPGPDPVSPSGLVAELQAHEYYDTYRQHMHKYVVVEGKKVPLRDNVKPGVPTIREVYHEVEPPTPRRPSPPPTPKRTRRRLPDTPPDVSQALQDHMAMVAAAADFRLKEGIIPSPGKTPPRRVRPLFKRTPKDARPKLTKDVVEAKTPPPAKRRLPSPSQVFEEWAPWEEKPYMYTAISPSKQPLLPHEKEALAEAERNIAAWSPGADEYEWGGESPVPPDLEDYGWMSPTPYEEGRWPWQS